MTWSELTGRQRDVWLLQTLFPEHEYLGPYSWKWTTEPTDIAYRRKSDGRALIVPRYHEDIAAAFGLLVAMEGRGFYWRILSPFDPKHGITQYWVGLTPHSCSGWNGRSDFEVAAESFDGLPAAICEVVYRALSEGEK